MQKFLIFCFIVFRGQTLTKYSATTVQNRFLGVTLQTIDMCAKGGQVMNQSEKIKDGNKLLIKPKVCNKQIKQMNTAPQGFS